MPKQLHRARIAWGLLALVPVLIAARSYVANAQESLRVSVRGPSVLDAAATYHVAVASPSGSGSSAGSSGDRVCRVQEQATRSSDTAAPYDLIVPLSALPPGRHTLTFLAVNCRNQVLGQAVRTVLVPAQVTSAGTWASRWVAPASSDQAARRLSLTVHALAAPVTARITRSGRTVARLATRKGLTASWTWDPGMASAGAYTAQIGTGGHTVSVPFTVTAGWAPISPPFPRCSVISWSYNGALEPVGGAGISTDVATAFARISTSTGIRFRQVASAATIQLGWKDLGTDGPDGVGGATWSGDTAIGGQVSFNTESDWATLAGFGRYPGGMPGRGALITHEILHSLGLGHVRDRTQVMYPVAGPGSPTALAPGDRAGLLALYHPTAC